MHRLPNYARRVEYLESTGTQYVDTGVVPDANTSVAIAFVPLNVSVRQFGCVDERGNVTRRYWIVTGSNGKSLLYNPCTGTATNATVQFGSSIIGSMMSVVTSGLTITANGTTSTATGTLTSDSQCSMGLFTSKYIDSGGNSSWTPYASMRLYSMKISDGLTLVRSFVPCRVGSTGYLFDEVTGAYFGNSGTGNFNLGTDIAGGASTLPLRGLWPMGRTRQ